MRQADPLSNLTIAGTPAYDVDIEGTCRGIDVLAEGTLFVVDAEDTTTSYPLAAFVAAGGEFSNFPYRLLLKIKRIVGDGSGSIGDGTTGTNIALADLRILH